MKTTESMFQMKITARIKKNMRKVRVHFTNAVANALADDDVSNAMIRPALLRSMGLKIGEKTSISGGSWFGGGRIEIRKRCRIAKNCYFDATGKITLEDNVVLSHGVTIITAQHPLGDSMRRCPPVVEGHDVTIGEGTFVGANVSVLPGVKIGKGCVIGVGAVVTKSMPDDVIVVGVPAKILRKL
jgi:acetyltransferase-like isoleucine patch superfamily enzyme